MGVPGAVLSSLPLRPPARRAEPASRSVRKAEPFSHHRRLHSRLIEPSQIPIQYPPTQISAQANISDSTLLAGSLVEQQGLPSADGLFRAFADPTRMRILNALAVGELCVCDLVSLLGARQPTVSRHLAYLKKCRLVKVRRVGAFAHCSLADPESEFHRELIDCVHRCFPKIETLKEERSAAAARLTERCRKPCV